MAIQTTTPRQFEVLRVFRDYRAQHGYSPTMQELGDIVGFTKVTAFEHVEALVRKGLLRRGLKHHARSLRLSPEAETMIAERRTTRLPLVGRIAAGSPIEAIQDNQVLDLEELFTPTDTFVLKVAGDSMIEDHIQDGDFVVCERRTEPRNGEIVVALLPEGEATLKRFYREKDGRIRLQPANANYEPRYVTEVKVQGVMVGVVRKV